MKFMLWFWVVSSWHIICDLEFLDVLELRDFRLVCTLASPNWLTFSYYNLGITGNYGR